nr:RNA polymerase beta'' subunit [Trochiscia hystrix]
MNALPMFYKKKYFFNRFLNASKKISINKMSKKIKCYGITENWFGPVRASDKSILDKSIIPKDIWSEKFWNYCFDKNRLKLFISWFLFKFGENKTLKLLEKFKYLGFHYATQAGISLSIDDLKIPPKKDLLIFEAEKQIMEIEAKYKKGSITGVEQFQMLIDTWHQVSETLKKEVVNYFEMTDFLNPVYMMAFSGARGNLSQVRQLAGMRGLMSDPQGRILDYPIQSNFREGLTLTEYIISSYGARKGIVDTALRTANAGYLTRRLVDVAQHVIISNLNCGTKKGIWLSDIKEGNKVIYSLQNRLIGRILATNIFHENTLIGKKNQEISIDLAMKLSKIKQKIVVRSPLTCSTKKTLCQLCYGWGLSQGNMVSIGEAVGIIAAQSIGEPGTQLTMRTFHTGGVFLGDTTDQIKAPYNGVIVYRNSIPGTLVRTPHGKIVFLTKNNGKFRVYNEARLNGILHENEKKSTNMLQKNTIGLIDTFDEQQNLSNLQACSNLVFKIYKIPSFTLLFFKNRQKVQKNQILAQYSALFQQKTQRDDSEQDVSSQIEGEVYNGHLDIMETLDEILLHKQQERNSQNLRSNDSSDNSYALDKQGIQTKDDTDISLEALNWGYLWILSGKIYQLPISSKFFPYYGDFIGYKNCLHRIQWTLMEKTSLGFLNNKSICLNKNVLFFHIKKIFYHEFGYFIILPVNKKKKILSSFLQNSLPPCLTLDREKKEHSLIIMTQILLNSCLDCQKLNREDWGTSSKIKQDKFHPCQIYRNDFVSKLVRSFYSPLEKFFLPFSLKDVQNFQNFNNKNTHDWSPKFSYFLTWLPSKFYKKNSGLFYEIVICSNENKNLKNKKNREIISYHLSTLARSILDGACQKLNRMQGEAKKIDSDWQGGALSNLKQDKFHQNSFNKHVFEIFNLQNPDFAFISFINSINSVLFYFNNSKIHFFLFHNFWSYWHKHRLLKFFMNTSSLHRNIQLKILPSHPVKLTGNSKPSLKLNRKQISSFKNKFISPFGITNSLKNILSKVFSLFNKKLFRTQEIQSEYVLWIPKYFYKIYNIESYFPIPFLNGNFFSSYFSSCKQLPVKFLFKRAGKKKNSSFLMPSGTEIPFNKINSLFYNLFFKYDLETFPYNSSPSQSIIRDSLEHSKKFYQSQSKILFNFRRQGDFSIFEKINKQGIAQSFISSKKNWLKIHSISKQKISFYFYKLFKSSKTKLSVELSCKIKQACPVSNIKQEWNGMKLSQFSNRKKRKRKTCLFTKDNEHKNVILFLVKLNQNNIPYAGWYLDYLSSFTDHYYLNLNNYRISKKLRPFLNGQDQFILKGQTSTRENNKRIKNVLAYLDNTLYKDKKKIPSCRLNFRQELMLTYKNRPFSNINIRTSLFKRGTWSSEKHRWIGSSFQSSSKNSIKSTSNSDFSLDDKEIETPNNFAITNVDITKVPISHFCKYSVHSSNPVEFLTGRSPLSKLKTYSSPSQSIIRDSLIVEKKLSLSQSENRKIKQETKKQFKQEIWRLFKLKRQGKTKQYLQTVARSPYLQKLNRDEGQITLFNFRLRQGLNSKQFKQISSLKQIAKTNPQNSDVKIQFNFRQGEAQSPVSKLKTGNLTMDKFHQNFIPLTESNHFFASNFSFSQNRKKKYILLNITRFLILKLLQKNKKQKISVFSYVSKYLNLQKSFLTLSKKNNIVFSCDSMFQQVNLVLDNNKKNNERSYSSNKQNEVIRHLYAKRYLDKQNLQKFMKLSALQTRKRKYYDTNSCFNLDRVAPKMKTTNPEEFLTGRSPAKTQQYLQTGPDEGQISPFKKGLNSKQFKPCLKLNRPSLPCKQKINRDKMKKYDFSITKLPQNFFYNESNFFAKINKSCLILDRALSRIKQAPCLELNRQSKTDLNFDSLAKPTRNQETTPFKRATKCNYFDKRNEVNIAMSSINKRNLKDSNFLSEVNTVNLVHFNEFKKGNINKKFEIYFSSLKAFSKAPFRILSIFKIIIQYSNNGKKGLKIIFTNNNLRTPKNKKGLKDNSINTKKNLRWNTSNLDFIDDKKNRNKEIGINGQNVKCSGITKNIPDIQSFASTCLKLKRTVKNMLNLSIKPTIFKLKTRGCKKIRSTACFPVLNLETGDRGNRPKICNILTNYQWNWINISKFYLDISFSSTRWREQNLFSGLYCSIKQLCSLHPQTILKRRFISFPVDNQRFISFPVDNQRFIPYLKKSIFSKILQKKENANFLNNHENFKLQKQDSFYLSHDKPFSSTESEMLEKCKFSEASNPVELLTGLRPVKNKIGQISSYKMTQLPPCIKIKNPCPSKRYLDRLNSACPRSVKLNRNLNREAVSLPVSILETGLKFNRKSNKIRKIYKNDKNVANFWLETKRLKIASKLSVFSTFKRKDEICPSSGSPICKTRQANCKINKIRQETGRSEKIERKQKVRPTILFPSLFLNIKKWNIEIHNGWFYLSQNWKNSLKYNKFLISVGQFNMDDLFFHQTVYFEFLPLSIEFIKIFQSKKQFVYENISWLKNFKARFLPHAFFQQYKFSKIEGSQIQLNFRQGSAENYVPVLIQKTKEYWLNNSIQYENLMKTTSISNFQKNPSFLFFCFHTVSLNKQTKTPPPISIFPSPSLSFEILKKLKIPVSNLQTGTEKASYQAKATRKKIVNRPCPSSVKLNSRQVLSRHNFNNEKKPRKFFLNTQKHPSKILIAKKNLFLIHYIIKCFNNNFLSFKLPVLNFTYSKTDLIKLNFFESFFSKIYTLRKEVPIERHLLLSVLGKSGGETKKTKSIFDIQNKLFRNIGAQNIVIQKFPSFFNLPCFTFSISQILNSHFEHTQKNDETVCPVSNLTGEAKSILKTLFAPRKIMTSTVAPFNLNSINKKKEFYKEQKNSSQNSVFSHILSKKFQKTIYLITNQNQIMATNNFAFTNYLSSYKGEILKQNYSKWYSFLKRDRILFLTNFDLISFYFDFNALSNLKQAVAKLPKNDVLNVIRHQNFPVSNLQTGNDLRTVKIIYKSSKPVNSFINKTNSKFVSSFNFNKISSLVTFSLSKIEQELENKNRVLAEATNSSSFFQKQLRSTYSLSKIEQGVIKEYLKYSYRFFPKAKQYNESFGLTQSSKIKQEKKIQTKKLLVKLFNKIYKISGFQFGYAVQKSFLYVGQFLTYGDKLLQNKGFHQNGQIIHVNLYKFTLRKGQQFFVSTQGIFRAKNGDFIGRNIAILTLPYQRLKTGDIIQGIPKVEQIFEARSTLEGRPFNESLPSLLSRLYVRYKLKLPFQQAVRESVYKIQQIIVNSIQKVYRSQGVSIADKHLEIIVRQMTSKVYIIYASHTNFFPGELIDLYLVEQINKILVKKIFYKPIILGITRASLNSTSFLSSASFQQVSKTLAKAAVSKKKDLLTGIKENVLLGNLMPAGTGYFRHISSSSPAN